MLIVPVNSQTQTNFSECLCPGDLCGLCLLPAMADMPPKPNESETCVRIREEVPPTSAQTGSNEYFPALDMSTMTCIVKVETCLDTGIGAKNFQPEFIVSLR